MSKVCLVPSPRCVKVMVKIATFPIPPVFCSPVGGCPIGFLLGVTKQETLCCHAALIAYDMSVQRFRYSDGRERKSRDKRGDECPRIWSAWGTLVQIVPRFSKKYCSEFTTTRHFRRKIHYSARNARIASAVLATAIPSVCPSVRLSVRPSVTRRYCVKTTARSTVQFG